MRERVRTQGAVPECWRREASRYQNHPTEHLTVHLTLNRLGRATATTVDGAQNLRLPVCIRAEMPLMNFGAGAAVTLEVPITLSVR